jgi:hypothetical protein
VHVISRDAAAVERFARFGYQSGMVPTPPGDAPAGFERFLPELLLASGAAPHDAEGARGGAR